MDAYRAAAASLTTADLTGHYTDGQAWLQGTFAPRLRALLAELGGGAWRFDDFDVWAAGSDADFISHLVQAVEGPVALYPGDWHGFRVGTTREVLWGPSSDPGALACLCIPSVRNGRLTADMLDFLAAAPNRLLNINLYPTLPAEERRAVAAQLAPLLDRAVVTVSFSRGFGLTASQLGIALVRRDHPLRARFATAWAWHSYYFNALAARAFLALDLSRVQAVDTRRRAWVSDWLAARGLPDAPGGSYYVRTFRPEGPVPARLAPLVRGDLVRLCMKPPIG